MPYVRIWIHAVWATKQRSPILTDDVRKAIFQHVKENAAAKNIFLDNVNGHVDHIHCLISLGREQSIGEIIKLIKGESSYWINKMGLIKTKFDWQDDYYAVSVCESALKSVRKYIQDQEEHHRKKSFEDEYAEFISESGFPSFLQTSAPPD